MSFIKGLGVGVMVATIVCLTWVGLDILKMWLGYQPITRDWGDTFFGAATGASTVYTYLTED